jgi:polyisoprenoid-binding protein YceI
VNSKLFVLVIAAFAIFANPVLAKKKVEKDSKTKVEVLKIDPATSTIEWTGSKVTGSAHHGNISVKSGQIEVLNNEIKGGNFTADMTTIDDKDLASNAEYKKKLETHLKSEDFFNIVKYPESTFKIKSVVKKSETEMTVKGDLTMIGKTQEIEFPATIKTENGTFSGTAELKLDRTKWDLKYGSGKFFKNLGDKMINDEFILKLNLTAKK